MKKYSLIISSKYEYLSVKKHYCGGMLQTANKINNFTDLGDVN